MLKYFSIIHLGIVWTDIRGWYTKKKFKIYVKKTSYSLKTEKLISSFRIKSKLFIHYSF